VGVNGAVTFNVTNGTYAGRFTLNAIVGASSTNTIKFNGNGSTIYDSTAGITAATPSLILFNGTDYVTFDNFTMRNANGGTFASAVLVFTNQADYNTINACTIQMPNATSSVYFSSCSLFKQCNYIHKFIYCFISEIYNY
jgi:hypothetical protein